MHFKCQSILTGPRWRPLSQCPPPKAWGHMPLRALSHATPLVTVVIFTEITDKID